MKHVLLIAVDHGPFEIFIDNYLVDNIKSSLNIYWESIYRSENCDSFYKGLEDPILAALFILSVFESSRLDHRVYDTVEKGVGQMKNRNRINTTTIPKNALIAARGAESVRVLSHMRSVLPYDLIYLIESIDIKKLVERCRDFYYVENVNETLSKIFYMLLYYIKNQSIYNSVINIKEILKNLENIGPQELLSTSIDAATNIRSIIRNARDTSNFEFVVDDMIENERSKCMVVVGGAHISGLIRLFKSMGIIISVMGIDKNSKTPTEIEAVMFIKDSIRDFERSDEEQDYIWSSKIESD